MRRQTIKNKTVLPGSEKCYEKIKQDKDNERGDGVRQDYYLIQGGLRTASLMIIWSEIKSKALRYLKRTLQAEEMARTKVLRWECAK